MTSGNQQDAPSVESITPHRICTTLTISTIARTVERRWKGEKMPRYIDADALKKAFLKPMNDFVEGISNSLEIGKIIDAQPTADVKETIPCEEYIHAKQHSYAPAECQWYCTISLQYHGGRFFCACGERGTDLLEWIHRGDDDEQSV